MASSATMMGPPPSMPPPSASGAGNPVRTFLGPRTGYFMRPRGMGGPVGIPGAGGAGSYHVFRPSLPPGSSSASGDGDFDGKRPRKSLMRKTVDYNSSFMIMLERRISKRKLAIQPDTLYYPELQPPMAYQDNPTNSVTTKFVKAATNKMRCPVFTLAWTPEGRRLITGASSGEFTLWNGLTFNFETILQAHDTPVRSMIWSHNDQWMVTGDHGGYIKYWQSNMNNVKMFQAHKEPVRAISFSPTDQKFASCSDDGTVRVWDFFSCNEEKVLRGHGSDVKCVDWHPTKGLIASGSKDNQQPIKIWEPKTGAVLSTLHAHKSTVMDIKWNKNGNWLLTASRDHLVKLFDIRNLKEELQTFRGHKKEAATLAWHPVHEGVFASGGSDGAIMFWHVGAEKEIGVIEQAHDSIIWTIAWHPVGHILCSGSNDHTCKFWTRNRPGDTMRDKYNLNTMPQGQQEEESTSTSTPVSTAGTTLDPFGKTPSVIPGMAPEDRVEVSASTNTNSEFSFGSGSGGTIPGLESDIDSGVGSGTTEKRKTPYAKPIPKNFQASWAGEGSNPAVPQTNIQPGGGSFDMTRMPPPMNNMGFSQPPPVPGRNIPRPANAISLQELQRQTTAIVAFGSVYPVLPGSHLFLSIVNGETVVKDVLRAEFNSR